MEWKGFRVWDAMEKLQKQYTMYQVHFTIRWGDSNSAGFLQRANYWESVGQSWMYTESSHIQISEAVVVEAVDSDHRYREHSNIARRCPKDKNLEVSPKSRELHKSRLSNQDRNNPASATQTPANHTRSQRQHQQRASNKVQYSTTHMESHTQSSCNRYVASLAGCM